MLSGWPQKRRALADMWRGVTVSRRCPPPNIFAGLIGRGVRAFAKERVVLYEARSSSAGLRPAEHAAEFAQMGGSILPMLSLARQSLPIFRIG